MALNTLKLRQDANAFIPSHLEFFFTIKCVFYNYHATLWLSFINAPLRRFGPVKCDFTHSIGKATNRHIKQNNFITSQRALEPNESEFFRKKHHRQSLTHHELCPNSRTHLQGWTSIFKNGRARRTHRKFAWWSARRYNFSFALPLQNRSPSLVAVVMATPPYDGVGDREAERWDLSQKRPVLSAFPLSHDARMHLFKIGLAKPDAWHMSIGLRLHRSWMDEWRRFYLS